MSLSISRIARARVVVATIIVTGVTGVTGAREARAAECQNPIVDACINSDTFWPNPGPTRFAGVGGTELVAPHKLSFGLVASYQSRPVVLQLASPGPGGSSQSVVDNQVTGNFLFAYGLLNRLQLDLALPVTFVQTGTGTSPLTGGDTLRDTAVRDLRFGVAYGLVPRARIEPGQAALEGGPGKAWAVAGRFQMSAPIGDKGDFAGERSVVFSPSVAADYRVWRMFFAAELGARIRPVAQFTGSRIGTQLVTGGGAGFDVLDRDRLAVLLEARGYYNFPEQHDTQQSAFGIRSVPNGMHIFPAEWMLSVRSAPFLGGDFSFQAGGGGPITFGDAPFTAPRFRFLLGVVYAPLDRDTDRDGIPDRSDPCPTRAGAKGGERPGCPDKEGP